MDFQIQQAKLNADQRRRMAEQDAEIEHAKKMASIEENRLDSDHQRRMVEQDAELKHAEKLARIEAKTATSQGVSQVSQKSVPQVSHDKSFETLKAGILAELGQEKPNLTQLASRLQIGRSTLYRHLGTLSETGEITKNGNGYEVKS